MNKYESYKQSRIGWINEVPSNWIEKQNKHIFIEKKEEVGLNWNNFQLLSLSKKGVIKRDIDNGKGKFPESFENYKKVECSDLIFCLYDIEETPRSVGLSRFNGMITGSYKIYSCTENPKFVYYWYLTIDDFKGLKPFYTGMRNVVRPETFLSLKIYIPPSLEQDQIVYFLDEKTDLIDKLISTKERKISLLKEQRSSIINQVVTKGLNPNVKMKDSGVEWIGEIPEHWSLIKMKYKGDVIIGLSYSPENIVDEGEGTLVMRSSNVQNGKPSFLDNVYVNSNIPDKIRLREGDILICSRNGSRNLIGKNCLITKSEVGLTFGVFMTIYRTQYYKFIYWLLNSPVFESQSGLFLTSTINQLTVSTLQNMVLPFVNDIEEQNEIIGYLNSKTKEIDDLVELEQKKINLLKEYRQSLISEVVTGKIKVTTDE